MTKKVLKLSKDEIRRIIFLKNELKIIILKSVIRNRQINNNVRAWCIFKMQQNVTYLSRQKNFCLVTGRSGGVWKLTNTTRHCINKFAQEGSLINIKSNNIK